MPPSKTNFYAHWRTRHGLVAMLRDTAGPPPERLLQAIWQHQRILRAQLRTLDGQSIRVLHPGFGSAEGGPDFRGAIVQIGIESPVTGDVEVDLRATSWRAHGHHQNPAFRNVILHVVWAAERNAAGRPTLALQSVLDAPLAELALQLEHTSVRTLPENLRGQCSAPLRDLSEVAVVELLREAAQVRLQNKAAQFRARAQQVGWEQSLWEGLFRALGYKHNVWPMQQLAEHRERWQSNANSVLTIQARLFGIAGLLPAELNRQQSGADKYLRRIWDIWWREREEFSDCAIPRGLWRFHGLRPANHPLRRLALAAHWVHERGLSTRLESWCSQAVAHKILLPSLTKILQVERDDYWSWHWTFRPVRLKKPQPLLGENRMTDLAVNVILPWLWSRAWAGGNQKFRAEIEHRFNVWPAGEDNAVLRLARQRLLGRTLLRFSGPGTAAVQQGLLQIVRDFCDHSNATCDGCGFPELVENWDPQQKVSKCRSD